MTGFVFRHRVQPLLRGVSWHILVIGGSVVVLAAGVIGVSSFALLLFSFRQQSFLVCPQALQERQYPAKYTVSLALSSPFLLPCVPFVLFAFVFVVFFASLVPFLPLPLPFLSLFPQRSPWVRRPQRQCPLVLGSGRRASS